MARPARGVRVGVFAGVLGWHALLVLLLLRERVVVVPEDPTPVMTWLRLDTEPRREQLPPPVTAPLVLPSTAISSPSADSPPDPPAPGTAITPPRFDWYAEASRTAREQFAGRLPTPRSLDDEPEVMELPAPQQREHQLGDLEQNGTGWTLWLSERCRTEIRDEAPLPPGQLRPMSISCLRKPSELDAEALEARKPDYLREPPIVLPPKGGRVGQPRPGPSMGGKPMP